MIICLWKTVCVSSTEPSLRFFALLHAEESSLKISLDQKLYLWLVIIRFIIDKKYTSSCFAYLS